MDPNYGSISDQRCSRGDVLALLDAEATILLENSGFFVDTVTTDGATWNRAMWRHFGLERSEVSCIHPCATNDDENSSNNRKTWFISDFSHLIKNLRNFIMSAEEIWTPNGVTKKKHFRAVLENDGGAKHLGLKLTPDHLDPKFF